MSEPRALTEHEQHLMALYGPCRICGGPLDAKVWLDGYQGGRPDIGVLMGLRCIWNDCGSDVMDGLLGDLREARAALKQVNANLGPTMTSEDWPESERQVWRQATYRALDARRAVDDWVWRTTNPSLGTVAS